MGDGSDAVVLEWQIVKLLAANVFSAREARILNGLPALLRNPELTIADGLVAAREVHKALLEERACDCALVFTSIAENSLRLAREGSEDSPRKKKEWVKILGADLAGAGAGALAGASLGPVGAGIGALAGAAVASGNTMAGG